MPRFLLRSFSASGDRQSKLREVFGSLQAFLCNPLIRQPPACSRRFLHGGARMERKKTRSDAPFEIATKTALTILTIRTADLISELRIFLRKSVTWWTTNSFDEPRGGFRKSYIASATTRLCSTIASSNLAETLGTGA
jgi:hypothetical protein